MLEFLQTGKAIYVLAAVCLMGMISKLTARNLYKRLIKETGNMMLTKNRWLRELRQKAEDTYRLNQGVANTRVFVEKQIYEAKIGMFTPEGWGAFSNQMTALCFLLGGAAAFLSYWYRCDSYYIVLYSSMGILTGIFNIMVDYGAGLEHKRRRLSTCLQDYLENSLWKRLGRDRLPEAEEAKNGGERQNTAEAKEPTRLFRGRKRENSVLAEKAAPLTGNTANAARTPENTGASVSRMNRENVPPRRERSASAKEEKEKVMPDEAISQLRKSLEQAAVGRAVPPAKAPEKAGPKDPLEASIGENWMKDLKPEEIKVLGEIIREYLG